MASASRLRAQGLTTTPCSPTTIPAARRARASPSWGGTFYNPVTAQFPSNYVGKYFYEDLAAGWIRVFDPGHPGNAANPDTSAPFASGLGNGLHDLKVDSAGNLYYLGGNGGLINKISFQSAPPIAPHIVTQPASQIVTKGQTATFTVPRDRALVDLPMAAPGRRGLEQRRDELAHLDDQECLVGRRRQLPCRRRKCGRRGYQ